MISQTTRGQLKATLVDCQTNHECPRVTLFYFNFQIEQANALNFRNSNPPAAVNIERIKSMVKNIEEKTEKSRGTISLVLKFLFILLSVLYN
jgi:hypothetical protein